jgi:predicted regulator of Ras-like GTPase activity (Roadblock/LC7/MglB family)
MAVVVPFTAVLAALCREVPGALGAVFVDDEGETVQRHVAHPSLAAYDLDVVGALVTPLVRCAPPWRVLTSRGEGGTLVACAVADRYVLVVVLTSRTPTACARRAVRAAARELRGLM